MAPIQRFFEVIKPDIDLDFIGKQKYWIGASITLVLITFLMLPINAYVLKDRGHMLNWGVDFRGGTEIVVEFSKPVEAGAVREAMAAKGFDNVDVVQYGSTMEHGSANSYMIRLGAVSVMSADQAKKVEVSLARVGESVLKKFEFSEGGDKVYMRFDRAVEPSTLTSALKAAGTNITQIQPFGPPQDHTYEVTLIGLDAEIRAALDAKLGSDAVKSIPQVSSVGAKAGKELQLNGLQALFGAIVLIVVYVAIRFDFRYGPGTIVALLHDAIIVVGAFAVTYKEFSLTTLAARVDHHRFLDERHHRRLRPYPRKRQPLPRPGLRPRGQPRHQRDPLAYHPDQRHRLLRDPGHEHLRHRRHSRLRLCHERGWSSSAPTPRSSSPARS